MARYALVVGIGENKHPLKSLTKTVGDAKAIAQVLHDYGGFRVEVLPQTKAGQVQYKDLVTAIETFVQQQATGNEALIYYTGHGFPLVKAFDEMEAFLAPTDCSVTLEGGRITSQQNGLSLASLNRLVATANLSNLVMLLDCCHSGYLLEDDLLRQTFADSIRIRKDYWLLTACRRFEKAWVNKSDPHSVFTGAILAGLNRDRADDQGVITAGSLFEYVQRTLRQEPQEVLQLSAGRPIELLRFQLERETVEVDESIEPYQGLNAFTPETARFFFGRDDEIQTLVRQVHTHCFVPLIGASGSGKSSLVQAGLVPRLQELGWRVLGPIKPGSNPIAQLKLALRTVFAEDEIAWVYECVDCQDLLTVLTRLPEPPRWLLVVDQFEEVFTSCTDRARQAAFIHTLTRVMQQKTPRLAIVTTMRADFIGPSLDSASGALIQPIQSQAVYLGPMSSEGLEAAIVQPVELLNYRVEERLLAKILHDVEMEANSLPLLQFALQQLWAQRDREQHQLTYAVYQQLGGVAGTLNQKVEKIYQELEASGQGNWVRRVLLKLVRTGEGTKDTRLRRLKTELLGMGTDAATRQEISSVITTLVNGRLLVSDRVNELDVIDLSHEALIQHWQRLAKWREQDRDLRRLLDRIEDAQRDWSKQGKKRQDLLQGRLLKDARQLLKQQPEAVAGTKAFIERSLRQRRLEITATLLIPFLVLGIPAEHYWEENSVKQDYASINDSSVGDQGESTAVFNLAGGCWAKQRYALIPNYFREQIFGNCRSLESAKLEKANLGGADLSGVDLEGANLSNANLGGADLSGADLFDADLSGADLRDAKLYRVDLSSAKLYRADLRDAKLYLADLRDAKLYLADLSSAELYFADLSGADLRGADLSDVKLYFADLSGADLRGADLSDAEFGCFKYTCTNLENIRWSKETQWEDIKGWIGVENIPPELKQQLGLR